MAAQLPADWPAVAPSQTLPGVYVALAPLGAVAVSSWELERELVASTLPGNIRAASGISVGSGSVTVAATNTAGAKMTPWSSDPTARIMAGGPVDWFAAYDGPESTSRVDLGAWQVSPVSGSLTTAGISIDLVEKQYAGRTQANLLPPALGWSDASWMVSALAAQMGFHATPPPVASARIAASLTGGFTPEVGDSATDPDPATWVRTTGPLGPTDVQNQFVEPDSNISILAASGVSSYLYANVSGTVHFDWGYIAPYACQLEIRPGGVLAVRNGDTAGYVTTTYAPGADPNHPTRVEVEMQRFGTDPNFTSFRARARSSATAAWSTWATSVATSTAAAGGFVAFQVDSVSSVSGMQFTTADDADAWAPVNADIDALDVQMLAPFLASDVDAWTGIQQACAGAVGAAWVTADGRLIVRNRDYLAGVGVDGTQIDIGLSAEDLPWSIDPADTADRLVVTYSPADPNTQPTTWPTAGDAPLPPVAWQASDAVQVGPHQTVQVEADLTYFANLFGPSAWVPAWNTDLLFTGSTWAASPNRDGTGTQPTDDALVITQDQVSAGKVILNITNTTAQTLYTVDATGTPCLILRGFRIVPQANALSVTRGVDADLASNPLSIDLGKTVQTQADAEAIADYIWGRVSARAWKASSIRVALDWSRDIGDVVRLNHSRTGLDVKAMITKVAYDGAPGQVIQTLDLVLLSPTWADFDIAWAGKTWADFDAVWIGDNWSNFDYDPVRTS